MKRILLYAAAIMAIAASCKEPPVEIPPETLTEFLGSSTPGVIDENGGVLFGYTDEECQRSFSKSNYSARIQRDDMSCYVDMVFSVMPSAENKNVRARITVAGIAGVQGRANVSLEVKKIEEDNVWLWDSEAGIGYRVVLAE